MHHFISDYRYSCAARRRQVNRTDSKNNVHSIENMTEKTGESWTQKSEKIQISNAILKTVLILQIQGEKRELE